MPACRRTHVLLRAWYTPRRADGIEVIAAAAGRAVAGHGHWAAAAALGVLHGTASGWLRFLRARAGALRQHAIANSVGSATTHRPPREPAGSPLNVVAAAVDCAMRNFGYGPQMT